MPWMTEWTNAEKAKVAQMLKQGLTAQQIADAMPGRTKGSVVGVVNRDPQLLEIGFARRPNGWGERAA